ncbi:MAG: HAD-IIB family hydrolase [Alphaproteobacteria bacterium]|nr:HAD-IIB family hydrolase [Alphaproteobacteria bacterium]
MYFAALATDYDGTLAEDGLVAEETIVALRAFRQSGRKLILVTGRELADLRRVFSHLDLFDVAVVENGAVLVDPATGKEIPLGKEPPPLFVEELRRRNVNPLSVGRSIVATWEPNEKTVLDTIRDLGLELQIVFNKGAVMVLPAGINKASGLAAALARLQLSPLNVVGIGDAENDHAFLRACGCAVAVANALPTVKADAEIVTSAPRGAGVVETIRRILEDDLTEISSTIERQTVEIARDLQGEPVRLHPQCGGLLIAGTSGGGKSTAAAGLIEKINERGFQLCVIDPEGDYADLDDALVLGDAKSPPRLPEIVELLGKPEQNVVINLLGIDTAERPRFLAELLPALLRLRAESARPHWLVIDEAHHLLPAGWNGASMILPQEFAAAILITVDPEHVAVEALHAIDYVLAFGSEADRVAASFCKAVGEPAPPPIGKTIDRAQALFWSRRSGKLRLVSTIEPRRDRQRHSRKYAEGELGEDKSFYFRGPDGALNLRAQNLAIFLQIAEGIDDRTWLHHLRAGDYSRWLRDNIKDSELAEDVESSERNEALTPAESRRRIKEAIERRYTSPA